MKRAILAFSAALVLLTSAPALADGFHPEHRGSGHDLRHERHLQPHHFGGFAHRPLVRPHRFGAFGHRPYLAPRHFGAFGRRPHFGLHDGRHFKPRRFGGRRHRY